MQKLFDELDRTLRDFVRQRDDAALVVRCGPAEHPVILKAIEGIDEVAEAEMFWTFPEDFEAPATYADAIVSVFMLRFEAVRLAMPGAGLEPWPDPPPVVHDESAGPAARLRALMAFSRTLLPDPAEGVAVWSLLPQRIADPVAWADLTAEVIRHEFPHPWCHHLRFILRDDRAAPALAESWGRPPRVTWAAPDFSHEAIERALEDEADDAAKPLEARLQALLILAHLDYSHRRYDAALEKYAVLLPYYAATRNATLAALVLNGIGEVHLRRGDLERAGQCFEAAVEPATTVEHPPVPVLLNVTLNLANLRMAEGRWDEAEAYYDAAEKLATVQRSPLTKVQAIENRGVCQYHQGKHDEARASWELGAMIARELDLSEPHRSLLERLKGLYDEQGDRAQRLDAEQQLAALGGPPPAPATTERRSPCP